MEAEEKLLIKNLTLPPVPTIRREKGPFPVIATQIALVEKYLPVPAKKIKEAEEHLPLKVQK